MAGETLGKSILLLDDETMILMGLEDAALAAGMRPLPVIDCEEALEIIHSGQTIDTAVLDFRLAGGKTCTSVANGLQELGVPFLLHSADVDHVEATPELADVVRIAKPSTSKKVIEAASQLLQNAETSLKQTAQ